MGRKFGLGGYPRYLIPVYNLILMCRCAELPGVYVVLLLAPGAVALAGMLLGILLAGPFAGVTLLPLLHPLAWLVAVGAHTVLWGRIAQRLGKDFWLWGAAGGLLLAAPVGVGPGRFPAPRRRTGGVPGGASRPAPGSRRLRGVRVRGWGGQIQGAREEQQDVWALLPPGRIGAGPPWWRTAWGGFSWGGRRPPGPWRGPLGPWRSGAPRRNG